MQLMRRYHLCLIVLTLLAGCGRGSTIDRAVISGTVSYQGRPVEDGLIRFVPIKGAEGPPAGATIANGAYTVKALGGVPAGVCRVEINGFRPSPASQGPPGSPASEFPRKGRQQYLPPKYNRDSQLEVTIEPGGGQTKDFNLQ
jgi:hypothetical protein